MENLLGRKGRQFSAKIKGAEVTGRIQVEDDNAYLCQDVKDGSYCSDMLGYKHSWCVGKGTEEDFKKPAVEVTDFRLHPIAPAEIEEYKDWQVGDVVSYNAGEWTVIFRSGELVVCKDGYGKATGNFTCDELHKGGFRLKQTPIEEEPIEITMDQIAEKFGVPVSSLKIKKD